MEGGSEDPPAKSFEVYNPKRCILRPFSLFFSSLFLPFFSTNKFVGGLCRGEAPPDGRGGGGGEGGGGTPQVEEGGRRAAGLPARWQNDRQNDEKTRQN